MTSRRPASAPPPSKSKRVPKEPDKQLSLLEPSAPAATSTVPTQGIVRVAPNMNSAFAKCEILRARARDDDKRRQVVLAVEFLLTRNGVAPEEALAQALDVLAYRVRGLVSSLQEVLNVEGYPVLTHDAASRQIRLDREKLAVQFEVSL